MAIAPEQIGIGISRYFTRPGTHPYDMVEWERREARIQNYKDGTDAFRQPDVEFPASWSQNATNIVAQKYFRGTLGTPERETSLKQVIDRIADTITAWGVRDGYFVDDQEGAAFRNELKYILVTQRAAFNSPVWFNIGVEGERQQASACQPYHAPVNTPAGAVPIGRLVESGAVGSKVFDGHGLTKIVAVKANGRKNVLRLHARCGLVLDVTADHLVWRRRRGEGEGFAEAGTLRVGDLLEWHQGERLGASYALTGAVVDCEIDRIQSLGEMDVFDIQTESGEYLSNNLRVHNCFILAVDDTMDGILNWYREEGIIFKGGSGSGINLSSIRSSREPLKGGGTASGPVSFMRGADASAGTIKCLHADTPIVTDIRGVVPIREVRVGDAVLTRHGYEKVETVHDNGVRPLVRVRTALGDEILCTPEHRFRVRTERGEEWREAGSLRPTDHVVIDLSAGQAGQARVLTPVRTGHSRESSHQLPTVLDEPFALWLGWHYGDGSVATRSNANFVELHLGDADAELRERYGALTRSVFGPEIHICAGRHLDEADASMSVRFSSSKIIRFLERNGLRTGRAHELRVPEAITSSPATVRAAFLAGAFEADGHVANGYPQLSTVSAEFARDVLRLLLSIGIPSRIHRMDDRRTAPGARPVHVVRVVGDEGMRRFAKLVGFVSERKSTALEAAVQRKSASRSETQWHLPHVVDELRAVWQRTNDQRLRRALTPYCKYRSPRSLSLLRARVLLERFPSELAHTSLVPFAEGRDFYTTVTVEPAGEGPTFDLTVTTVHEYLVNSVITHNSGGKTRRAAKMVILNADHPDIEEFIWCKAMEERKARALRDAGFDMDLDGRDSHSIQYQNANNSVRVTDEFMQSVLDDRDWDLKAVTTGENIKTVKARDIMRQIADAAWECADPGMQFDSTINRWHTAPNTGRINGSNPCFPGSERVHTDKGLIRFAELVERVRNGETFGIYTHDVTNADAPAERLEITKPEAIMLTGFNEIVRLLLSNGMELRCTPGHKVFTTNRGYVAAEHLTSEDCVKLLDLPAPAVAADAEIAVTSRLFAMAGRGDRKSHAYNLPEKWTPELAHYVGWLVGDGCISGDVVTTVYGSKEEQKHVLPVHRALAAWMNAGSVPTPSLQENGTVQLRQSRRVIARFFEALGVSRKRSAEKVVPEAVYSAPEECVDSFLRGLFDADGCVYDGAKSRYVGLGSTSRDLLLGVQRLLTTCGIFSSVYETRGPRDAFAYTRRDGTTAQYSTSQLFDLRISGQSIARFAQRVGFSVPEKKRKLEQLIADHRFYKTDETVRLIERFDDGIELTFNLAEPRNHSYIVNGVLVRNCSEYMHIDNSACNLASINLLKYLDEEGNFDVDAFKHTVEVVFTAQEILVGNADYPTEKIAENSRKFRQLGLGYANLGALLMALGLPYDSDGGRAWAAAVTALMTGHAYTTSARTAARMGPFAGFGENAEPMVNVLRMHRAEVAKVDEDLVPPELLGTAQQAWDEAVDLGERYGVRNSQASVLAPTGTIGLMMDCDTTGVEPDLALTKAKKLVGGGTMFIVNQTIPRALRRLGYSDEQINGIVSYIDEHKTIIGAPAFDPVHLPVFACSMGDNAIDYMGHVKMMGAVQPFISGAISKTVNMPEEVTVEDVEQLHVDAWKLGIKAIAIYRDNCKVAQPLATQKKASAESPVDAVERIVEHVIVQEPVRQKLPRTRNSKTFSFRVADCRGFATVAEYEDGRPGELFLNVSKQGSTLAGIMDSFAIAVSHGLQYGVPLRAFIETFTNRRFEPAGMTDDPDIRIATSLVDYIFRKLAVEYLPYEERVELGVLTSGERTQPTLPGVEEAATANEPMRDELPLADQRPSAGVPMQPGVDIRNVVLCHVCGDIMQRAGSCYACPSCGATSGCS